jgi:hypothetical protein
VARITTGTEKLLAAIASMRAPLRVTTPPFFSAASHGISRISAFLSVPELFLRSTILCWDRCRYFPGSELSMVRLYDTLVATSARAPSSSVLGSNIATWLFA